MFIYMCSSIYQNIYSLCVLICVIVYMYSYIHTFTYVYVSGCKVHRESSMFGNGGCQHMKIESTDPIPPPPPTTHTHARAPKIQIFKDTQYAKTTNTLHLAATNRAYVLGNDQPKYQAATNLNIRRRPTYVLNTDQPNRM